jgi:hypothetical protein
LAVLFNAFSQTAIRIATHLAVVIYGQPPPLFADEDFIRISSLSLFLPLANRLGRTSQS